MALLRVRSACLAWILAALAGPPALAADAADKAPAKKSDDPQAFWDPQAQEQKNKPGQYQVLCPGLPAAMWNAAVVPMGNGMPPLNPAKNPLAHRVGADKEGEAMKPRPGEKVGFTVQAPKAVDPREALGVVVYISPGQVAPEQGMDNPFSAYCDERRLVCVSATTAGNPALPGWRVACAVAAVQVATRRYAVDTRRVYVCGASGGGRVTSYVMLRHPELFRGACPIIGCNSPDMWMESCKIPAASVAQFCGNTRLVVLEGGKDFNRAPAKELYDSWYRKRVRHATYIEEPECAHAIPGAAYRAKVLDFWDMPVMAAATAQWKSIKKDAADPKKLGRTLDHLIKIRPMMQTAEWGPEAMKPYQEATEAFEAAVKAVDAKIAGGDLKGAKEDLTKLEAEWGDTGRAAGKPLRAKLAKAQEEARKAEKAAKAAP